MIVAVSDNDILGLKERPFMPWVRQVPRDMQNFTKQTTGDTYISKNGVIMGRITWDTLPEKFKPLPDRENIILSRSAIIPGTRCFPEIDSVLNYVRSRPDRQFWVMGGNQIYRKFFPHVNELHITRIHHEFSNLEDNSFVHCIPEFKSKNKEELFNNFHQIKNEFHESDQKNKYPMTFQVFRRKEIPSTDGSDFCQTC